MMEDLMPHLAKIKAPFGQEKVYKEECAFSFDNPVSTDRMEKIVLDAILIESKNTFLKSLWILF